MKKYCLFISLFILIPVVVWAWNVSMHGAPSGVAGGCLGGEDEGFEGSGTPTNWSTSGTVDFDSTANILECTESLRLTGNAASYVIYDPSFDYGEFYNTFWMSYTETIESNEIIIRLRDTSSNVAYLLLYPDGTLGCEEVGGSQDAGSTSLSAATTYKIKVYYSSSGGVTAYLWSGSSWGQECSSSDGTSTTNVDSARYYFATDSDTENLDLDYMKFSSSDISSPD